MSLKEEYTEKWFDELSDEVETSFLELEEQLKEHFIPDIENVDRKVTQVAGRKFSYPLEEELYRVFKYIRGDWSKPKEFEEVLAKIKDMIWDNPFLKIISTDVNWGKWEKTKLGQLISVAEAKAKYDAEEDLTPKELSLLMVVTPNAVRKRIKEERLKADKRNNQWYIEASEYEDLVE